MTWGTSSTYRLKTGGATSTKAEAEEDLIRDAFGPPRMLEAPSARVCVFSPPPLPPFAYPPDSDTPPLLGLQKI